LLLFEFVLGFSFVCDLSVGSGVGVGFGGIFKL
jgi:hypothetical protein